MDALQLKTLTDAILVEVNKGAAANREALEKMLAAHKAEVDANLAKQADIAKAFTVPGSADATHKGQKFSMAKFYRSVFHNDWRGAEFEKAISDEATVKVKAMGVVPDSTGGFAVPTEVMVDQMIPLLYANSVCANLGATQLTGLTAQPVKVPKVTGGTTAYWMSESATITASELSVGQVETRPHILATVTAWSELFNMAQPAIESMIRNDQAIKMALAIDLAAVKGTGNAQPLGLVNWTGVSTESVGSSPTYDKLTNMIADVEGQNALAGNLGWATSVVMKNIIRQTKDVTGGTDNKANIQPLGNRELWNEQAKTICGYKQQATTQLGDNDLIFGNWADLVLAQWGGLMVAASMEVGFLNGQRHLRTMAFVDSFIRNGKSFSVATA